jgi:oxazoline/thiazoline dehydrogenase
MSMNSTATVSTSSHTGFRLTLREDAAELLAASKNGLPAALQMLSGEGVMEAALMSAGDESEALSKWIPRLTSKGWICHTATSGNQKLATFVPTSEQSTFDATLTFGPGPYVLSRFACLHREDDHLVLESPLTTCKVLLYHPSAVAFVNAFVRPARTPDALFVLGGLPKVDADMLLTILANSGVIVECDESGEESEPPSSTHWEFFDLLFHTRSRLGRHANPYGGRPRFSAATEADASPARAIPLFVPDMERLRRDDPPFAHVVASRRCVRAHGATPITAEQLGEFLYRSARVDRDGLRPFPSAGGCYELELYIVVHQCKGLDPGLYHYHSQSHHLEKLADTTDDVTDLLSQADIATGGQGIPQILVILAARMHKLNAKYQGLAYSLALKDTGVLQQTMSLTAAAMGLAGCPLGGADSDSFARASGLDYYRETSVGEFILGSLPEKSESV